MMGNRQKLIAFFKLLGLEGFHAEHHNMIEKLNRIHNDDPVHSDESVDRIVRAGADIFAGVPNWPGAVGSQLAEAAFNSPGSEPGAMQQSSEPAGAVGMLGTMSFIKKYPCGCHAGPGPANLPDYCPDHGNPEDISGCVAEPYMPNEPAAAIPEPVPAE
jgi:hypothetical protein